MSDTWLVLMSTLKSVLRGGWEGTKMLTRPNGIQSQTSWTDGSTKKGTQLSSGEIHLPRNRKIQAAVWNFTKMLTRPGNRTQGQYTSQDGHMSQSSTHPMGSKARLWGLTVQQCLPNKPGQSTRPWPTAAGTVWYTTLTVNSSPDYCSNRDSWSRQQFLSR